MRLCKITEVQHVRTRRPPGRTQCLWVRTPDQNRWVLLTGSSSANRKCLLCAAGGSIMALVSEFLGQLTLSYGGVSLLVH